MPPSTPKRRTKKLRDTSQLEPDKLYRCDMMISGRNLRTLDEMQQVDGLSASERVRKLIDWAEATWKTQTRG